MNRYLAVDHNMIKICSLIFYHLLDTIGIIWELSALASRKDQEEQTLGRSAWALVPNILILRALYLLLD